jgi:D-alanyl-lipoteichoic acid acyltransferase DltB (MBOAT superfamily)
VICGIWHGPKMTFVIFGFVQAFLLIYEMQSKDWRAKLANRIPKRWYQAMSVLLTFVLISFCFILFRANDLSAVINIFSSISRWDATQAMLYLREKNGTTIVGLLITLFLFLWMDEGISQRIREKKSKSKTLSLLLAMMVVMIMLGMVLGKEQFIYFQF